MDPKVPRTLDSVPTDLDAVAWVRGVRDAMYEKTKKMSREEFKTYVARAAASVSAASQPASTERGTG